MRFGIAALALLAAACGSGSDPAPAPESSASIASEAGEAAGEATEAPAPPATAVEVKTENDLYEFAWSYPAAAAAIPGLKAELDSRMDRARGSLISEAKEDQAAAAKDGYPYRPHSYGAEWKVVTDLPEWLSLSSELYTYSGGAHGMSTFESVLWDKRAGAVRQPEDLFVSKAALSAALKAPFCAALDKEREKRRGAPLDKEADPIFTDCIEPIDQTIILGSSNGRTFDRIGLLVPPYNAGAYAEGSYEVTLPVTGKVMAALKPQYRSSFGARP